MAHLKKRDHLEKTRHKSGDNIKIYVTKVGCKDVDCIHQAEDRDK
jgi:transcription antitermination factor NusA-like protein